MIYSNLIKPLFIDFSTESSQAILKKEVEIPFPVSALPLFTEGDRILAYLYQVGICNQKGEVYSSYQESSSNFCLNHLKDQTVVLNIVNFLNQTHQVEVPYQKKEALASFSLIELFKKIGEEELQTFQIVGSYVFQLLNSSVFFHLMTHCFAEKIPEKTIQEWLKLPHIQQDLKKPSHDIDFRLVNNAPLEKQKQLCDKILKTIALRFPKDTDIAHQSYYKHPYIVKRCLIDGKDQYAIAGIKTKKNELFDFIFVGKKDGKIALKNLCLFSTNSWKINVELLTNKLPFLQLECFPFSLSQALVDLFCDYTTPVDWHLPASWLKFLREGKKIRVAKSEQAMVQAVVQYKEEFLALLNHRQIKKNKKTFSELTDAFYFYQLLKKIINHPLKTLTFSSSFKKVEFILEHVLRASLSLYTCASINDETVAEFIFYYKRKGYFDLKEEKITNRLQLGIYQALVEEKIPFSLFVSWISVMAWLFKPRLTYHNQEPIFQVLEGFSFFLPFSPVQALKDVSHCPPSYLESCSLKNLYFYFASSFICPFPSPLTPYFNQLNVDEKEIKQLAFNCLNHDHPLLKSLGLQTLFTLPSVFSSSSLTQEIILYLPSVLRQIPFEQKQVKENILTSFCCLNYSFNVLNSVLNQPGLTNQEEIEWLLDNSHEQFTTKAYQIWIKDPLLQQLDSLIHFRLFQALCRWSAAHALKMADFLSENPFFTAEKQIAFFIFFTQAYRTHFKAHFLIHWDLYKKWLMNLLKDKAFSQSLSIQQKNTLSQSLFFILNSLYDHLCHQEEADALFLVLNETHCLNFQQQSQLVLKRAKQLIHQESSTPLFFIENLMVSSSFVSSSDFHLFLKKSRLPFRKWLLSLYKKDLTIKQQAALLNLWESVVFSLPSSFLNPQDLIHDLEFFYSHLSSDNLNCLWSSIEKTLDCFTHAKDFSFILPLTKIFAEIWFTTKKIPPLRLVRWIEKQQVHLFEKLFKKEEVSTLILLLKNFYHHKLEVKELKNYTSSPSIAYPLIHYLMENKEIENDKKFEWILASLQSFTPSLSLIKVAFLCTEALIDQKNFSKALNLVNALHFHQNLFLEEQEIKLKKITEQLYEPEKISPFLLEEQLNYLMQHPFLVQKLFHKCFPLVLNHFSLPAIQVLLPLLLKAHPLKFVDQWIALLQTLQSYPQSKIEDKIWTLFQEQSQYLTGSSADLANCWLQVIRYLELTKHVEGYRYFNCPVFFNSLFNGFTELKQQAEESLLMQMSQDPSCYFSVESCQKIIDKKKAFPLRQNLNEVLLKNLPLLRFKGILWGLEIVAEELKVLQPAFSFTHHLVFIEKSKEIISTLNLTQSSYPLFFDLLEKITHLSCQNLCPTFDFSLTIFSLWNSCLSQECNLIQLKLINSILESPFLSQSKKFKTSLIKKLIAWTDQKSSPYLEEIIQLVRKTFRIFPLSSLEKAQLSSYLIRYLLNNLLIDEFLTDEKKVYEVLQEWSSYTFISEEYLQFWVPLITCWSIKDFSDLNHQETYLLFENKMHVLLRLESSVLKLPNKEIYLKELESYYSFLITNFLYQIQVASFSSVLPYRFFYQAIGSFVEKLIDSPHPSNYFFQIFNLTKFLVYRHSFEEFPEFFRQVNFEESSTDALISSSILSSTPAESFVSCIAKKIIKKMESKKIFKKHKELFFEWNFWLSENPILAGESLKNYNCLILRLIETYSKNQTALYIYRAIDLLGLLHYNHPCAEEIKKFKPIQKKILECLENHVDELIRGELLITHLYNQTILLNVENKGAVLDKNNKNLLDFFHLYIEYSFAFAKKTRHLKIKSNYVWFYQNCIILEKNINTKSSRWLTYLEDIIPLVKEIELDSLFNSYSANSILDYSLPFYKWTMHLLERANCHNKTISPLEKNNYFDLIFKFLNSFVQTNKNESLVNSVHICLSVIDCMLSFPLFANKKQAKVEDFFKKLEIQVKKLNQPFFSFKFFYLRSQFIQLPSHQINSIVYLKIVENSLDFISSFKSFKEYEYYADSIFKYFRLGNEPLQIQAILIDDDHQKKQLTYVKFLEKIQLSLMNLPLHEKVASFKLITKIYQVGLYHQLINLSDRDIGKIFIEGYDHYHSFHPALWNFFHCYIYLETHLRNLDLIQEINIILEELSQHVMLMQDFSLSHLVTNLVDELLESNQIEMQAVYEVFRKWCYLIQKKNDKHFKDHVLELCMSLKNYDKFLELQNTHEPNSLTQFKNSYFN